MKNQFEWNVRWNFLKEPKLVVEINSGELYVSTNRNEMITTLLGSCVAVCLYDPEAGVGGMNHFMLPNSRYGQNGDESEDLRYGTPAMDILLKGVVTGGGHMDRLKAKVFGGGEMIRAEQYNVAKSNIEFALDYLKQKAIPICAMDVGGNVGRKIYYQLKDHQVFVKKSASIKEDQ